MTGSPLLFSLPVLAFILLVVYLHSRDGNWPRAFVLSAIAWGVYLSLTSEFLSLLDGLYTFWIAVAWLVPVVLLALRVRHSGALTHSWAAFKHALAQLTWNDKAIVGGIVLICGILLGIALIAPSNNIDSGLYHMARVMHWAQNASLRPFPTIMEHQLLKPIWAETAILHLRTLWGNDRPANLVQWFSMVGSLIVVSGIVSLLGGGRGARVLGAAYAVSLPMGILQSTSTQNDYVAAFWAVCLAYLVVLSVRRNLAVWELAALAASVGLAVLTKGTGFVYAPPLAAWFLIHEWTARGTRRAVAAAISIAGISLILNAGFWARNVAVYGGPYGTSAWLQRNLWVSILEEPPVPTPAGERQAPGGLVPQQPAPTSSPTPAVDTPPAGGPELPPSASPPSVWGPVGEYAVRLAQTAGRNLTVPTGFLSRPLTAALASARGVFGEAYADEIRAVSWNDEDFAGNPLHLALVPVSLIVLLLFSRGAESRASLAYAFVTLVTFAMIPIVIGHGPSMFGIRYQLSFFVLWAPLVGRAAGLAGRERLMRALAVAFLLVAIPWILLNKSRPLIGLPPTRTVIGSILVEDPATVLLPWSPRLRDDYLMATQALRQSGCMDVGLRADSGFLEYPLWWLLDAPQSGLRLEALETTAYMDRYADPRFAPCAVVCANCGSEESVRGLPLVGTYDSIKVYLAR